MSIVPSIYRKAIDRVLGGKLHEHGFKEVRLRDCMSYEALFRKGDLWFGTSWDYRDQHIDVNLGHLYWIKDVMPRVIVAGHYSSFCSEITRLDPNRTDYLEVVATTVADSLESALQGYRERPALAETKLVKLRPYIIGRVTDAQLAQHEA